MKNIIKEIRLLPLALIVSMLIGGTSCKNVLDEEVYSFISKENFYQNANDAEAAIYGIYNRLTNENVYGRWYFDLIHLTDDQVTIHRNPLFIQMDDFNYAADHAYIEDLWTGLYSVINTANVCIGRIPSIDMDEDTKNSYVAEARCIRASIYFTLVRLWGSVPLSLEEVGDEESVNISKKTVDEIYQAIIEDLEYAEKNLPTTRESGDFGRVAKGAARALLTDVLLTREDWSGAAAEAKKIIDMGQYALLDNFEDIFSIDNEVNDEIIYSIVFDGVNQGNWMASFSHAGGTDNVMCYNGAQVWQVDTQSDMWLNWSNSDPRKQFTVYEEYLSRDGTYKSVYNTSRPYPCFGKWNAPDETYTGKCPLNPILYRYADVLLMYAEALSQANGGPDDNTYEAINMIRRRGYGQPISQVSAYDLQPGLSVTAFRDSVIKERSYEFVVEGKRLFDLMRTGQFPQILIDMGKDINTKASLFPIPSAEIEANSALTSENQNDGY